jgi:hypothetical protein
VTEAETRLLDELAERGFLRRIEYVRSRMHEWRLAAGDHGHIDVEHVDNLDPRHPLYVRVDPPVPRRL